MPSQGTLTFPGVYQKQSLFFPVSWGLHSWLMPRAKEGQSGLLGYTINVDNLPKGFWVT